MAIVNETLSRLQGDENKIVTKIMSIVFSQEEKFSMYIEELSNNDFSLVFLLFNLFLKKILMKGKRDVSALIKLLTDLKNEMSERFK